ncbi:alpha/beta hydrolase fold domain-containing protein [Nocardia sp. CA-119907]|uniref:alpha/beta hydrolase fold domain-containing protein n=1 Tax=Nocardia sp. CA-119907 TaxID=3239973 RepID=UPI003D964B10
MRAVTALLKAGGQREMLGSAEGLHAALVKRDRKAKPVQVPGFVSKAASVVREDVDSWPVYRVTPSAVAADVTVVFMHGGGFIGEVKRPHWSFVRKLNTSVPAECVMPVYPLVPQAHAIDMVATAAEILARTIERRGAKNTIIMGNSAGAGLALAATQALLTQGKPLPARVVLISPWLDMSLSDPAQAALADDDPFHQAPGLVEIGRLYADDLDTRDPRVSPLFGPVAGLPPLTVFCGTREMALTDARTLVTRARDAGVSIDYHEGTGLVHNYALMPTPEGHAATDIIINACRRTH